jgi:hypothetical protein
MTGHGPNSGQTMNIIPHRCFFFFLVPIGGFFLVFCEMGWWVGLAGGNPARICCDFCFFWAARSARARARAGFGFVSVVVWGVCGALVNSVHWTLLFIPRTEPTSR